MNQIITIIVFIFFTFSSWSMELIQTPIETTVSFTNNPVLKKMDILLNLDFGVPSHTDEMSSILNLKEVELHLYKLDGQELFLRSEITVKMDERTESECEFHVERIHFNVLKLEPATGSYFPEWLLRKIRAILSDMETADSFGLRKKIEDAINAKITKALYLCNESVEIADYRPNPNKLTMPEVLALDSEIRTSWLDHLGFMRLKPLGPKAELDNENPVLFTSEYIFLLKHLGFLKGEFREHLKTWIHSIIDTIRIHNSADGTVVRGLFNRRPNDFERHFSRDEQFGLIALDWAFDNELGYCQELYDYGSTHEWHYSNRTFEGRQIYDSNGKVISNKEALMASLRLPEFRGLLKACLGKELNYTEKLQILLGHGLDTQKETGTSGKILSLISLEVMKDSSDFLNFVRGKYHQELRNTYKLDNPYEEIMNIYFLVNSPERPHPIIRLSRYMELSF